MQPFLESDAGVVVEDVECSELVLAALDGSHDISLPGDIALVEDGSTARAHRLGDRSPAEIGITVEGNDGGSLRACREHDRAPQPSRPTRYNPGLAREQAVTGRAVDPLVAHPRPPSD